jgi:antitoxin HicB
MGDSLKPSEPTHRAAIALLLSGNYCRSLWIHQENAEDTAGRSGIGEETKERSDRMIAQNPHIGSSLDEFLREEGILEEARSIAVKEALAWQVEQAMKREKITKAEMARRMHTSRAALDRLLDPKNVSVTLQTLFRAAHAVGSDLRIELR